MSDTRMASLIETRELFPGVSDESLQKCIDTGHFHVWKEDGTFFVKDLGTVVEIISNGKESGC